MKKIKFFRIAVSAAAFIAVLLGFSGFLPGLAPLCKGAFFPALSAGALAALFWILLALLWGRVFCSWGCPLGFIQDIAGFLGRLLLKRKNAYRSPRTLLRCIAGTFLLVLFMAGAAGLAGWFEPFSIAGRGSNALFRPLLQWIGNHTDWWHFSEFTPAAAAVVIVSVIFIAAVAGAAFFRERFFCNTLCPAGFLLGIFSRLACFKLKFGEKCVKCRACEKVCKAGCIDVSSGSVDSERCLVCGNCLGVCRFSGLEHACARPKLLPDRAAGPDPERRAFLAGILLAGAAGAAGAAGVKNISPLPEKLPCAPPGAGRIEDFTARCTGCQLCIANCPGKVLTPAVLEYGLAGFGQPRMSTAGGFCDYECSRCSNICPSGALKPLALEIKKRCKVGSVSWSRDLCVVVTDEESCGACAEHCPTGALTMVEYKNGLTLPSVTPELCIGCGGCEYICPVRPRRAVAVTGVREQKLIAPAAPKKALPKEPGPKQTAPDNGFPF